MHSFAGIGLGIDREEQLVSRIRKNKKSMTRWLRTKVLIIDESASAPVWVSQLLTSLVLVSMIDGELFDKLARIGSMIRKDAKPFGGIQVRTAGQSRPAELQHVPQHAPAPPTLQAPSRIMRPGHSVDRSRPTSPRCHPVSGCGSGYRSYIGVEQVRAPQLQERRSQLKWGCSSGFQLSMSCGWEVSFNRPCYIHQTRLSIVQHWRSHPTGNASIDLQYLTHIRISSPSNCRSDGLLKVALCGKLAPTSMRTDSPLFSMTRIRNASLSA